MQKLRQPVRHRRRRAEAPGDAALEPKSFRFDHCCLFPITKSGLRVTAGDLGEQPEELALAFATNSPVHGYTLITVVEALTLHPEVEVPPRGVLADSSGKVVPGLVEVEVVILIEKDGLRQIARRLPGPANHLGNLIRVGNAVPVDQDEVRHADHVFRRDNPAAVGCARVEPMALVNPVANAFDEFVDALGAQDSVMIAGTTLIVDLDQYVAVAAVKDPSRDIVGRVSDSGFVLQPLVLPEVEVAQDHDHSELVGLVENAFQTHHKVGTERTIRLDGGILPGLVAARIALWRAALEIDGECKQTVPAPLRHGRDEFTRIALGIPLVRVGIYPVLDRGRIPVVEDALDHPGVKKQSLNRAAVPGAVSVSRLVIDVELVADDGDAGLARKRCFLFRVSSGMDNERGPRNGDAQDQLPKKPDGNSNTISRPIWLAPSSALKKCASRVHVEDLMESFVSCSPRNKKLLTRSASSAN
jgi:hypothetical protein